MDSEAAYNPRGLMSNRLSTQLVKAASAEETPTDLVILWAIYMLPKNEAILEKKTLINKIGI